MMTTWFDCQGYEALDPAVLATLRLPQAQHDYTGIGLEAPRSRVDPEGYLEPVDELENGDQRSLGQVQRDQDTSRSVVHTSDQRQTDAHRQGYEGLDPVVVEELRRRPRMPHAYASLNTGATNGRSAVHSYLEVIG